MTVSRAIGLLLALALAACSGAPCVRHSDCDVGESCGPAGACIVLPDAPPPPVDAEPADAAPPADAAVDASPADASPADAASVDASPPDAAAAARSR